MLIETLFDDMGAHNDEVVERLQNFHKRNFSLVLWSIALGMLVFVVWGSFFTIDQTARASGEVIAASGIQEIQSVDGGVLATLNVKEGDRVHPGEVLATLDQARFGASVKEIQARLAALEAQSVRLRAELTHADHVNFPPELDAYPDVVNVEKALFEQRRTGFDQENNALQDAANLAQQDVDLVQKLSKSGDVNASEIIRSKQALNAAQTKIIDHRNQFFEQASSDLAKAQDSIAQNEQVLAQRQEQLEASVFIAKVPGIVKNIKVTTIGGVLSSGEELMQIVPTGDQLIIEAKVRPADIALVHDGLEATIRFDPFDYTIYGPVRGKVTYVSPDTLKDQTARGDEMYYRVNIESLSHPVTTTTGHVLDILPGMTAQVDIRTGERTVMEYLLKPIIKTLTSSLGER